MAAKQNVFRCRSINSICCNITISLLSNAAVFCTYGSITINLNTAFNCSFVFRSIFTNAYIAGTCYIKICTFNSAKYKFTSRTSAAYTFKYNIAGRIGIYNNAVIQNAKCVIFSADILGFKAYSTIIAANIVYSTAGLHICTHQNILSRLQNNILACTNGIKYKVISSKLVNVNTAAGLCLH